MGFLYGGLYPSVRFRVTSTELQISRSVLIEMFSPCFLNSCVMSFLVRSDCGPFVFLRSTSPSSLKSPTLFLSYFSLRLFRRKRPISSQTSTPSYGVISPPKFKFTF